MKKTIILVSAVLLLLSLTGCTGPAVTEVHHEQEPVKQEQNKAVLERNFSQLKDKVFRIYAFGYSELYSGSRNKISEDDTVCLKENQLVIGNNIFPFTMDDVYLNCERTKIDNWFYYGDENCHNLKIESEIGPYIFLFMDIGSKLPGIRWFKAENYNEYIDITLTEETQGGQPGEGGAATGSYAFNNATGSQANGSVTLTDDGKWSYTGDKMNPAASEGTYTVSGTKVTLSWTAAGYELSESFTITVDGSTAVWKSDSDYVSSFFSMLFGVASGNEMTFSYTE